MIAWFAAVGMYTTGVFTIAGTWLLFSVCGRGIKDHRAGRRSPAIPAEAQPSSPLDLRGNCPELQQLIDEHVDSELRRLDDDPDFARLLGLFPDADHTDNR